MIKDKIKQIYEFRHPIECNVINYFNKLTIDEYKYEINLFNNKKLVGVYYKNNDILHLENDTIEDISIVKAYINNEFKFEILSINYEEIKKYFIECIFNYIKNNKTKND